MTQDIVSMHTHLALTCWLAVTLWLAIELFLYERRRDDEDL